MDKNSLAQALLKSGIKLENLPYDMNRPAKLQTLPYDTRQLPQIQNYTGKQSISDRQQFLTELLNSLPKPQQPPARSLNTISNAEYIPTPYVPNTYGNKQSILDWLRSPPKPKSPFLLNAPRKGALARMLNK